MAQVSRYTRWYWALYVVPYKDAHMSRQKATQLSASMEMRCDLAYFAPVAQSDRATVS